MLDWGIMLFVLGIILAVGLSSLAIVANSLRKAPEGYEDDHGFHIVARANGSAIFRRNFGKESEAGSLTRVRVHP